MKKQKKTTKANIFLEHLFLVGWVQSLAQLHYYSLRLMDCALFRKEQLFHQLFSTLEVSLSITITSEHFVTKHSARSPSIGKLPTLSCFPRKHCNTFLFKLGGESLRLHQVVEEVEECKQWRMHSNPHFVQPQVRPPMIEKNTFFLAVYKQTKFFWPYQLVESMGSVGTSKIRQI